MKIAVCPYPFRSVLLGGIGGVVAISTIGFLAEQSGHPLILGSFGASCVLLFGFPDSPFSQPKNVIGGHLIASFIGLAFLTFFGFHWWSMALAVGTAISLMMLSNTVHPPAGLNPVIVMLSGAKWSFLVEPTLIGAVLLVIVSFLFSLFKNKFIREKTASQ